MNIMDCVRVRARAIDPREHEEDLNVILWETEEEKAKEDDDGSVYLSLYYVRKVSQGHAYRVTKQVVYIH